MHKIPSILMPYNFARKNLNFSGNYKLDNVPKIKNITKGGKLELELEFSFNENLIIVADGKIKFNTILSCCNCLNDIKFKYNNKLHIAFVDKIVDEYKVNDKYEIINNKEQLSTIDFIADEVLLALPMFAKHTYKCTVKQENNIINNYISPFAILKY